MIKTELALADLATVEKQLAKLREGRARRGDKEAQRIVAVLSKVRGGAERGQAGAHRRPLRRGERALLKPLFLLTTKPAMYVANVAEHGFDEQSAARRACARTPRRKARRSSPICAAIEAEIAELDDDDKRDVPRRHGLTEPGLDRADPRRAIKLLGLQTYFTAGAKEVRAWTIHVGDTAPQAAGVIHTDFEKGFIRAEDDRLRRLHRAQGRAGREGGRQDARSKARSTSSRTATSCTSGSTSESLRGYRTPARSCTGRRLNTCSRHV